MNVLVALEARLTAGPDGRISSPTGVEGPAFWQRYLDVFSHVTIAARTTPAPERDDGAQRPAIESARVSVARLPDYHGPWEYLQSLLAVRVKLRRAVAEADALCLRAPGPIAAMAWRLRGPRPFAVEVVGDPHEALAPGAVQSVVRPLARARFTRDLAAMCRTAAAVSYVTEEGLPERYPAKWWTSYSSLDLDDDAFIDPAELAARAAWRARPSRGTAIDPMRVVAVGSLAQAYKGYDVLIDALARLRARGLVVDLTLVGDGELRGALALRAAQAGVGLKLPGRVPAGAAVRAHLDAADVFVLPSRSEGLPRVLLEAMARGVPAIGSHVGGVPRLLPQDRIVPPGDVDALAAALLRLKSKRSDPMGIGARDRASAHEHHVSALAPKRNAVYQRLHDAARAARA